MQSVVIHHMYQGKERREDGLASGCVSILPMSFLACFSALRLHLVTSSDLRTTADIGCLASDLQILQQMRTEEWWYLQ